MRSRLRRFAVTSTRTVPDGVHAGIVSLDLTRDGTLEDDGAGGTRRVGGATHASGSATSGYGRYEVDLDR